MATLFKFWSLSARAANRAAQSCSRAWMHVKPLNGVPEFGNALSALVRAGLLQRGPGFSVKPSDTGYAIIWQRRAYRRELKRRPVLFDRCMWDQPIELRLAA